ncbi:hypothetical protein M8J77_003507 [Diaphorina citri]|nr:hypothetical protein M8J77_023041 [Diaphorina citri]KAI5717299.1 hypothetical protein M8J77_003507 [Diaphorina citri]
MNWLSHVNYAKDRALSALNALKIVSNKKWGISRATLLKFYKSFVLPIFDYGCIVYASAKERNLSKLNTVHHSGIRIATGALRTSPIPSLYVESGIPSLKLRRDKLTMNYIAKVGGSPFNPVHNVLFNQVLPAEKFTVNKPKPLCLRYGEMTAFVDRVRASHILPYSRFIPPWFDNSFLPDFDFQLSSYKKADTPPLVYQQKFLQAISSNYSTSVLCYTDGSKSATSTSCAFSIDGILSANMLNPINSIFSAELIAILLCLRSIKNHPAMRFLLVSDSMGSLSAIANPYFSCPIISQIYSAWCDLKTVGKYVKLMWCPSHCGIRGNEAVDQAAKDPLSIVPRDREEDIVNEAIRNLSTPLKLCTPHDFKPWIAKLCRTQWQRSWDNILINKLKKIKPIIEEWPTSQRSNRMEEVVLTRLRIGHTRLTHKHIFTREPQPLCQCGVILTIHHILVCITHAHIRASLPSPPSLADDVEGIDSLFLYLKTLNLFNLI